MKVRELGDLLDEFPLESEIEIYVTDSNEGGPTIKKDIYPDMIAQMDGKVVIDVVIV